MGADTLNMGDSELNGLNSANSGYEFRNRGCHGRGFHFNVDVAFFVEIALKATP